MRGVPCEEERNERLSKSVIAKKSNKLQKVEKTV